LTLFKVYEYDCTSNERSVVVNKVFLKKKKNRKTFISNKIDFIKHVKVN